MVPPCSGLVVQRAVAVPVTVGKHEDATRARGGAALDDRTDRRHAGDESGLNRGAKTPREVKQK